MRHRSWVGLGAVLLVATAFLPSFANEGPHDNETGTDEPWAVVARGLVGMLSKMSDTAKEPAKPGSAEGERRRLSYRVRSARMRIADGILWRLWLLTGKPPLLLERDETFEDWLRRNVREYRDFISRNAQRTPEELHRIGVKNAVGPIASPLWYMTIRYLSERASYDSPLTVYIWSTSNSPLTRSPLSNDAYRRMAQDLSQWIKENEKEMVWDGKSGRFRPRSGAYVNTDELAQTIYRELSRPAVSRQQDSP